MSLYIESPDYIITLLQLSFFSNTSFKKRKNIVVELVYRFSFIN